MPYNTRGGDGRENQTKRQATKYTGYVEKAEENGRKVWIVDQLDLQKVNFQNNHCL